MTQQQQAVDQLFAGQSEMAMLMRSYDWSKTSLGASEHWSQSLKTAVRIMLTSRQAMFVWWGRELINLYNDAYKAIVGGKHPEALGQPASVVWHEIWDQVGPRAESALFKNEGTYDEALLLIMERNGYPEETYYTFSYSPIPDDQGSINGIICANTDDTQRIIGERQLALLRELAAKTVDARTFDEACTRSVNCLGTNLYDLPFAMIYLVDPDRHQVVLAGTSGIDRLHPAVPNTVSLDTDSIWPFAEVIQTQKLVLVADLVAQFSNLPMGAWDRSPHQAVAVPIAPSGQTGQSGILVAGLNPLRLFDSNYRSFIDLVAGQISASIANANAYEEERKRAEALAELDQAKTVFFSNISHEFRTPLTLMLSPLQELSNTLHQRLNPDEREQLQLIQRNGLRLQKLVNTLLDFSRIEAGRIQASFEPIDLATYTAELASVFRSLIEQAGMNLIIDCSTLPQPVYIDREMWEKIVLNLISNAFKFTFTGSITVQLRSLDRFAELSITDTGVGIPETELPRLFERFHRVNGTRSRTYEGSGIGLALVQELVKLHGGTIHVTSQVDRGTAFTITLPFGSAHLPQDQLKTTCTLSSTVLGSVSFVEEASRWLPENNTMNLLTEASAIANSGTAQLATRYAPFPARILLADDNADMRDYIKRLLGQDWQVETVSDGGQALDAIERDLPDLILSDVMMPRLDGFGLLRILRSNPRTQDIPIILLSARAGEESRIEGLEAGADDYLIKPFSARELVAKVEANLKLSRLRQEATQQEQTLRMEAQSAKDQLENILSRIDDQFFALDREWRYIYVNDRVTEALDISKGAMLGKCIWDLFPETISSIFEQEVRRAVMEQIPVQFEYFYAPLNCWYENRVYPALDGLSVFATDISDRKQAEAALRESESRFRQMTDSAPMLVWMAGTDKLCHYFNQSWLQFTGRTMEQEMGNGWAEGVHPDDLQRCLEIYTTTFDVRQRFEMDYRLRHFTGAYRWILDVGMPRFTPEGEFLGYIGTCFDIHDRKQVAAEREMLLAREQAARETAEAANRVKDEFLAVLSHELRSPLNPILGWSRLLQTGKLTPDRTEQALMAIERNAKLQAELIEDLLDISRILSGKLSLMVNPVNLVPALKSAIETVQLSAEAKSIDLRFAICDFGCQPCAQSASSEAQVPSEPKVMILGDATRLQQVVWNLLSNAVKFTPPGGQIELKLECYESPISDPEADPSATPTCQSFAQITVRDNGKGIAPHFLPYVFDYFRQADSATTRQFGGLGLGLAIVRHLVELHGGTVQANSLGEGQGSTFTVRLPLLKTEGKTPQEHPVSDAIPDRTPLEGIRILLVDDDMDTREFIAFALEESGAIVTSTTSAMEALQILYQSSFDLLISDIGMPEMDGYMLIQQVRAMLPEQGGTIPAIALTAYAGELNQKQALRAGFQRHVPKPIEPYTLIEIISRMLDRESVH